MENELKEYGARRGYVSEILSEHYRVVLRTPQGWIQYKFPKSLAVQTLLAKDFVRCFIVDCDGKPESRLEKIELEQDDPVEVRKRLDAMVEEHLEEILGELKKRGGKDKQNK